MTPARPPHDLVQCTGHHGGPRRDRRGCEPSKLEAGNLWGRVSGLLSKWEEKGNQWLARRCHPDGNESVDTRSRKESETCLPVGPSLPVRDGPAVPPVGRPLSRRGLGRTGRPQGPSGIWEACAVAPLTPPATRAAQGAPEKEGPRHVLQQPACCC